MVECVDVLMLLVVLLPLLLLKRNGKQRLIQHDSILTGDGYYNELIGGHEETFRDAARMDKPTFGKLVNLLVQKGKLKATQGYCYLQEKYVQICVAQKILIFIYILCGHSQRDTAHRFQHSLSTTSTIIHDVADCILECKDEFIRTPRANDITHDRIAKDPKFKEFEGCLGALDGSHVPAIVRSALHGRFRNRKKFISQNVLGVCDFDMLFTYVLAGWEGSAHDGRVLQDAVGKGLALLTGRYYLGDAGYALSRWVLTPYRGVRYHLKEWARGTQRPQNKEELFNLRHASLRNVIERVYGVIKKRFPILSRMLEYDYPFQVDLVRCCFMLHNFIRLNQHYEDTFDELDEEEVEEGAGNVNPGNINGGQSSEEKNRLNAWRDGIAQRMWEQYQSYLEQEQN